MCTLIQCTDVCVYVKKIPISEKVNGILKSEILTVVIEQPFKDNKHIFWCFQIYFSFSFDKSVVKTQCAYDIETM
jgi:hypothetical protein